MPYSGMTMDRPRMRRMMRITASKRRTCMAFRFPWSAAVLALAAGAAGAADTSVQSGGVTVNTQPSNIISWFDPATGTGFVSAGAIQSGWNDGAPVVIRSSDYDDFKMIVETGGFYMVVSHLYSGLCTWTTSSGQASQSLNVDRRQYTRVMYAVSPNRSPLKMGVLLQGLVPGSQVESNVPVPINGGPCVSDAGNAGAWSNVVQAGVSTTVQESMRGAAALLKVWPLPAGIAR
jgi:hypothetical protein